MAPQCRFGERKEKTHLMLPSVCLVKEKKRLIYDSPVYVW